MLSKYKMMVLAAVTCTLLGMESAQAALSTVSFSDDLGRSMVVTYDESALVSTRPDPYGLPGTSYDAVSFTVDGTPSLNPGITFYDNFSNGYDYIYFVADSGSTYAQLEMDISIINGTSLAQVQTLNFGNLSSRGGSTLSYSGVERSLTSLTAAAVPEPSAALLGLLGVVAGAFTRKRRA